MKAYARAGARTHARARAHTHTRMRIYYGPHSTVIDAHPEVLTPSLTHTLFTNTLSHPLSSLVAAMPELASA